MTDICPTNSTECLLRAIVDAQSGFDWNPLNFAFTAALSILAVIVAVVAAIQAAFAAGPGRLKASASVIGPKYHALSKTSFKPIELRFRTQVKVPWIDIETIVRQADSARRPPFGSAAAAQDPKRVRAPYVAGWACLLHQLGISDLNFQTDVCDTDYLPSDIMVPPAFIAVGTLVLLALCAGCDHLIEDASLISAQSPGVYMEIHNHSNLGLTATYRTFDITDTVRRLLKLYSLIELDRTIDFAQGYVSCQRKRLLIPPHGPDPSLPFEIIFDTLAGNLDLPTSAIQPWSAFINNPKGNFQDTQVLIGLLLCDHPPERTIFPFKGVSMRSFLTYFRYTVIEKPNASPLRTRIRDSFAALCPSATHQDITELSADEYATELGDFCEWSWLTSVPKLRPFIAPSLRPKPPYVPSSIYKYNRPPSTFRTSDHALHYALRWLSIPKYIESMDGLELSAARDCLHFQLAELDCWLLMHAQDECRRVATDLIHRSPYIRPGYPPVWTIIKLEKVAESVLEEYEIPYTKTAGGTHVVTMKVLPREKIQELADRTAMLDEVLERRGLKREDLARSTEEALSGSAKSTRPSTEATSTRETDSSDEKGTNQEKDGSDVEARNASGIDLSDMDEKRREALQLLLFFRAVLVGALIESGVDSTQALKLKNKNQVVMLQ